MKKTKSAFKKTFLSLIITFFCLPTNGQEFVLNEGFQFKPQIGIWFGPVTPLPGTSLADTLSTNLGGGLFFRLNLPFDWLQTEIGISFANYTSNGTQSLDSVPTYGALSYKLPFNMPIELQAKLGGAANYFSIEPEKKTNTLPALFLGLELSFPAGKWVNIGMRVDYYYAYEGFIDTPIGVTNFKRTNGHLLNFGLMVNFNWIN